MTTTCHPQCRSGLHERSCPNRTSGPYFVAKPSPAICTHEAGHDGDCNGFPRHIGLGKFCRPLEKRFDPQGRELPSTICSATVTSHPHLGMGPNCYICKLIATVHGLERITRTLATDLEQSREVILEQCRTVERLQATVRAHRKADEDREAAAFVREHDRERRPHNVGGCECADNSKPCTSTGREPAPRVRVPFSGGPSGR